MSKYSINTEGIMGQTFVASQLQYTAHATYSAFVASAAEGELGVFLNDATLSLKTDALAAGDEFFIAMKHGGINFNGATEVFVDKTPILKFNELSASSRTDYDAPVTQVAAVGYNGTAGSLGIDLSVPGTQELAVSVRSTAPGNQPFPVQESRVISTKVTDLEYDKVAALVSDLNGENDFEGNFDSEKVVVAEVLSNGAVTAGDITNNVVVRNGDINAESTAHGVSVGDYVSLGTNLLGGGAVYKIVAETTNAIVLDRPYAGASGTILAANAGSIAYVDGTTELGVLLTGANVDEHFVVSVQDDLEGATVSELAAWKLGSGSGASIVALEKEAEIFAGNGAVQNAAFKDDYGTKTKLAVASLTYDRFFLSFQKAVVSAGAPLGVVTAPVEVMLAVPSTGNTPSDELDTIFGL